MLLTDVANRCKVACKSTEKSDLATSNSDLVEVVTLRQFIKGYKKNGHEISWLCTIHNLASTFNNIDVEASD